MICFKRLQSYRSNPSLRCPSHVHALIGFCVNKPHLILPPSLQHRKYFSSGRLTAAGPALDLADVGREDEGVYVCVADNQVSRPVTESIALNVLCEHD